MTGVLRKKGREGVSLLSSSWEQNYLIEHQKPSLSNVGEGKSGTLLQYYEGAGVNQCLLPDLALEVCCSVLKLLRCSRVVHETVLYHWGLTGTRM